MTIGFQIAGFILIGILSIFLIVIIYQMIKHPEPDSKELRQLDSQITMLCNENEELRRRCCNIEKNAALSLLWIYMLVDIVSKMEGKEATQEVVKDLMEKLKKSIEEEKNNG